MAWTTEKIDKEHEDLVWSGSESGIAVSPHKGTANMQNVNLSTETGAALTSYSRVLSSQSPISGGTLTVTNGNTNLVMSGGNINYGGWVTITSGQQGNISGTYYFLQQTGHPGSYYAIQTGLNANPISPNFSGTLTFSTVNMSTPVQGQTEKYIYSDGTTQYKYYVLDVAGLLWVLDTNPSFLYANVWINYEIATTLTAGGGTPTGLGLLNGWLFAMVGNAIWCKSTVMLTNIWVTFFKGGMQSLLTSLNPHFCFTGHQGRMYYCDGDFIGSIFPNSALLGGGPNIQSYGSYSASSTTGTITDLIDGSLPIGALNANGVPATFFCATGNTIPTALSSLSGGSSTMSPIVYILYNQANSNFQVFAAASGGSALNLSTGAAGTQYFNTFFPISTGGEATITFTPQNLNLPFFETSQSMAEIGNLLLIGGKGNTVYPWNQVDTTPSDLIQIPENDIPIIIAVNNMGYIFAGHKGNIYITNGSSASAVISVPDYCAGVPGTPSSYIEPYFTWGGADYIRGRVYFSILDQTASKTTGNCGGIWSFQPTQNLFFGQDMGLGLRMENTNSYGNLNGYAKIIMQNQVQTSVGVQYFSAWQSTYTGTSYGIDASGTVPATTAIIETDVLKTGTMLNKESFAQVEYKLASPLLSGESVQIYYRFNITDAWTTCGSVAAESGSLSGYFTVPFQNTQWLQFQAQLIPNGTSTYSGIPLIELRLR
jgi:hypothetical protein